MYLSHWLAFRERRLRLETAEALCQCLFASGVPRAGSLISRVRKWTTVVLMLGLAGLRASFYLGANEKSVYAWLRFLISMTRDLGRAHGIVLARIVVGVVFQWQWQWRLIRKSTSA